MARKLASIQIIEAVDPIPNADRIERIKVLGWQCVARKGEFRVGELCVYVEIDSILPEKPEFEFLRERKFRVKTIKLKGQLSQGICFPISILPLMKKLPVGLDVTEKLGITKYELPDSLAVPNRLKGYASKPFPGFCRKTDEQRIQSCVKALDEIKGKKVYISQKQDGTSFTAYYDIRTKHFGVCSRNFELRDPSVDHRSLWQKVQDWFRQLTLRKPKWWRDLKDSYWDYANETDLHYIMKSYCETNNKSIAIQGELCGAGIRGNKLNLPGRQLYVFNVWDISEQKYLDWYDFLKVISNMGLKTVPILQGGVEFNWTLEQLLELAKGEYYPGSPREGIVIRPMVECKSEIVDGGRLSFKVINNDFLLKHGE